MNRLKKIGIFIFIIYILLCGVLYFLQDKVIFRPAQLSDDYVFRTGQEVEIPVDKNISLNCLWMKTPNPKGVILYLHGNRGSIRRCIRQAENMTGNQYDIFMPDYRGYGKSDGKIFSEEQIHQDNQKVYDFLKQHYGEDQIVITGYSLGSGMAAYLASKNNPQQLVLIAPYLSMLDLKNRRAPFIPDFLLKYHLNSESYLKEITLPVTLFHGHLDKIIPFDSSKQLASAHPKNFRLFEMKNEGHRGAIFNPIFRNNFKRLLK